jgi:hypothetical protein
MSYPHHPQQSAQAGWGAPPQPGGGHDQPQYGQGGQYGQYGHQQQYGQPPHRSGQYAGPYGQQPHGHQQYGHAPGPAGPGHGQGQVVVDIKHHPLAFAFTLVTPKITINGHQVLGRWGRNALPLPPGQHQLRIHLPYFLPSEVGPAALNVPVQPGQSVELEYRAPMWAFSPGALGPPPQQWNGMTALLVVLAIPIALLLILTFVGFLSALV